MKPARTSSPPSSPSSSSRSCSASPTRCVMTGIAQVAFPGKADGSQVKVDGKVVGSRLHRPGLRARHRQEGRRRQPDHAPTRSTSSRGRRRRTTAPPARSSPTAGRTRPSARFFYRDQLAAYLALEGRYDPGLTAAKVPVDAVTTSASGVDPHISKANAAHPGAPHRRRAPPPARPRRPAHRRATPTAASSASSASPASTSSSSTSPSTRKPPPDEPQAAVLLPLQPRAPVAGDRGVAAQARPARAGPQPGHVRGRGRRGDHDDRVADPALRRATRSAAATSPAGSRSPSRSGCG